MMAPFVVVVLKPEIATGSYKFTAPPGRPPSSSNELDDNDNAEDPSSTSPSKQLGGISAVEAAFLLTDGQVLPTLFARLTAHGFCIVKQRMVQISRVQSRELYGHELHRTFDGDEQLYSQFLDSFGAGVSLALLLTLPKAFHSGSDDDQWAAVRAFDELAGPFDPAQARQRALTTSLSPEQWPLRAVCGLNAVQAAIQSSATPDCAVRERGVLFPGSMPLQLERATVALLPSLLSALPDAKAQLLTSLARQSSGAIVVRSNEQCALPIGDALALCGVQDPSSVLATNAEGETEAQALRVTLEAQLSSCDVLQMEGLNLSTALRRVLGPAAVDEARMYFPESVRAQLQTAPAPVENLPVSASPQLRAACARGLDSGALVSFDSHLRLSLWGTNADKIESTLALIKPGTASDQTAVTDIMTTVRAFGFHVAQQRRLTLSRDQAALFYGEHRGKPFFPRLVAFMTSGELVALELSRTHAISMWRGVMGPTNSLVARQTHPWSLRARFGVDGTRNTTHGSDSLASAARELALFFGKPTPRVDSVLGATNGSTQRVAQLSLRATATASWAPPLSLETELSAALGELLELRLEDPLEACRWLGQRLLERRSALGVVGVGQDKSYSAPNVQPSLHARTSREIVAVPARMLVAVVVDSSIPEAMRALVADHIYQLATHRGYAVVDAAGSLGTDIEAALGSSGRSRVVIFGADLDRLISLTTELAAGRSGDRWQTRLVLHVVSPTAEALASGALPIIRVRLPGSGLDTTMVNRELDSIVHSALDPVATLLVNEDDHLSLLTVQQVAKQLDVLLVTPDSLVAAQLSPPHRGRASADLIATLEELRRTNATLSPAVVLELVARVANLELTLEATPSLQSRRLLLWGFRWSTLDSSSLERALGRVHCVVVVSTGQSLPGDKKWMRTFRECGLVRNLELSPNADHRLVMTKLGQALGSAFAPVVGLVVGSNIEHGDERTQLEEAAVTHGFACVDMAELAKQTEFPVDAIVSLMRGPDAGRDKWLLVGFPDTADAIIALIERVAIPRFIVFGDIDCGSALRLTAYPEVIQIHSGPSSADLGLAFSGKSVTLVVGDTAAIKTHELESLVGQRLGVHALSYDGGVSRLDDLLLRLQSAMASRCAVVVKGGDDPVELVAAVAAHLGNALAQTVVVEQVPVRRRKPRIDDQDPTSSSDEDEPPAKPLEAASSPLVVRLEALKVSVELVRVLETATSAHIARELCEKLRPCVVVVVGHPKSFYIDAVGRVARQRQLGVVDLTATALGPSARLEALERAVARSPFRCYLVDGFPRVEPIEDVDDKLRTAPEQLWTLERHVGPVAALVRFTVSVDVLVDQCGPTARRLELEDAQDSLDAATTDLAALIGARQQQQKVRSRTTNASISCERSVTDTVEALNDLLACIRI